MQKRILYLSFLLLSIQSNSQDLIDRLYHTGKVWGYMKYHHSNITRGNIDWDSILIVSLNGIKNAPNQTAFQDSLNVLIYRAGPLQEYIDYWGFRGDSIKLNKDFSWFSDPYLSKNVQDTLFNIKSIFKNESSYYLSREVGRYGITVPLFQFDKKYYKGELFPEENKRILAVYRYWNMVEYFYHHKSKLTVSWDIRLKEFIKDILAVKTKEEYAIEFKKITKTIEDSKASFSQPVYDSIIGYAYCPFRVKSVENKTIVVGKLSSASELEIGDEIIEIDNQPIDLVRNFYRALVEGSNPAAVERNVDEILLRGPLDKFSIRYIKKDKSINLFENRRNIYNYDSLFSQKYDSIPWKDTSISKGCKFGIIKVNQYHPSTKLIDILEVIWNNDAWIFDLRGSSSVDFDLFAPYIYRDSVNYIYHLNPSLSIPGEFYRSKFTSPYYNKPIFEKNIILLVDEDTKDLTEKFGLSLNQRKNVIVIGSMTDGSGINIEEGFVYLPGLVKTQFSLKAVCTKDFISQHSIGILPNHIVRPTIEGIRNGLDEVLEFALKCEFASPKTNGITSMKNEIKIYPNPVRDFLNIELNENKKSTKIELYSLLGQKLIERIAINTSFKLDLSSCQKGLYILRINNSENTFKIIKE